VAPAAVARAVPGEPVAHHDSLDIGAIEVADRNAPIIRSLAGQLTWNLFAEHERLDGFRGLSAAWLTPLRRRDPLKPNRHVPRFDRIAVPNVGDLPDQRSVEALSSRSGPRDHNEAGEQAQEVGVHDVLTANVQVEDIDPSYTGTTAMAILPLPLPPGAETRALLHHILEHGDIVGVDAAGRMIIELALDDGVLEKLMTFDAEAAELEEGSDAEPDADDEEDGPPVVVDFVRPKLVAPRRGPGRVD
jgi:hypothetical protein